MGKINLRILNSLEKYIQCQTRRLPRLFLDNLDMLLLFCFFFTENGNCTKSTLTSFPFSLQFERFVCIKNGNFLNTPDNQTHLNLLGMGVKKRSC